jgi:hypothetical protein
VSPLPRRLDAQRAFMRSLSFFRAAGDILLPRRVLAFLALAVVVPAFRPPRARAQRARAAAAIFARVAADIVRRVVVLLEGRSRSAATD